MCTTEAPTSAYSFLEIHILCNRVKIRLHSMSTWHNFSLDQTSIGCVRGSESNIRHAIFPVHHMVGARELVRYVEREGLGQERCCKRDENMTYCWNDPREARMDPPIHTLNRLSVVAIGEMILTLRSCEEKDGIRSQQEIKWAKSETHTTDRQT